MPTNLEKIKFDKLVSEMRFLETEFKYQKMITEGATPSFNLEVRKELEKRGRIDVIDAPPSQKPNRKQRRAAKKASKGTNKLFKKIAKELHPDKLINQDNAEGKKEKFLEASEAKDEDNALKLYSIALELGLAIDTISDENMAVFQQQIDDLKKEITNVKGTWIYGWQQEPAEDKKEIILKKFVDNLIHTNDNKNKLE